MGSAVNADKGGCNWERKQTKYVNRFPILKCIQRSKIQIYGHQMGLRE
jgi:hypothetical protein